MIPFAGLQSPPPSGLRNSIYPFHIFSIVNFYYTLSMRFVVQQSVGHPFDSPGALRHVDACKMSMATSKVTIFYNGEIVNVSYVLTGWDS